jgi:nitrogen regulatory protein P-II 1
VKKVEAIVRVERLRNVREHLKKLDIGGVILHSRAWVKDIKYHLRYRGLPVDYDLIPTAKFELFVPDEKVESVIMTIKEYAQTGEPYDGVIAVSNLENWTFITPSKNLE